MLNKPKPLTLEEQKHLQAVQAWYEPAMYVFNQLYSCCVDRLRKRGDDITKAAVNKMAFRAALEAQYPQLNEYHAKDIQTSLCKAGRLTYIGANYLKPAVEGGCMKFNLIHGDCLEELKKLPENSIDAVITDPPYGIRFMGKAWDGADIEKKVNYRRSQNSKDAHASIKGGHNSIASEAGKYDFSLKGLKAFEEWTTLWAKEAYRVLKPGGHLISFAAPRSYHRMTSGIEDAGFEIRDQMQWVFGSGFPKSHNLSGKFQGWGTGLKPGYEPICLARKPLVGSVAMNMEIHGTGAINIDECRVPIDPIADQNQLRAINKSVRDGKDGWGMGTMGEYKSQAVNQTGRWPANLIHDGSDDVLAMFPITTSGGGNYTIKASAKEQQGNTGAAYSAESRPSGTKMISYGDTGSAARFFYCAKASPTDRHEGLGKVPPQFKQGSTLRDAENLKDRKGNFHPTVKPTDLMRYLCRLVTPKDGTVLDPFMGSGSTGKAAILEGFNFIGIERESEYFSVAQVRCQHALKQEPTKADHGDLFSGVVA